MRIIITSIADAAFAFRDALVKDGAPDLTATELPGIVTEASLIDTIASLETANDKRHPDSMAQVSPRALVVALAVLKAVVR